MVDVVPLDSTLGARITGVALGGMSDGEWREVEDAFHEYGALVFPAQHTISINCKNNLTYMTKWRFKTIDGKFCNGKKQVYVCSYAVKILHNDINANHVSSM